MKKNFLFLCAAMVMLVACDKNLPVASYDIIPQPKEVQLNEGMVQNIAKGRLNKFFKESCLLNQVSLVADPKTVAEYIQAADKEATVCNFVRIKLGE